MKTYYLTLIIFTLALYSCKKDNLLPLPEDNGCIEKIVIPATAYGIDTAEVRIANNLFRSNGIDIRNYRYYRYSTDSMLQNPPHSTIYYVHVRADQYANGLRIFFKDIIYHFRNGFLYFISGHPTNGTKLNTSSRLTLGQLRKLFIDAAEQDWYKGAQYKDVCLKAEFGYLDLNAWKPDSAENLIKAWKVTPRDSEYPSEYPVAYFQDDDGKLLGYDNGIRFPI
jgi:hypothetical protein